jgi:hypothetical protein
VHLAKIDCCVKTLHKAPTLTVPEAWLVAKSINMDETPIFLDTSNRNWGGRPVFIVRREGGGEDGD